MSWNFRIVHEAELILAITEKGSIRQEETFTIREVYYDEEGEPSSCSEGAYSPYGETLAELQKDIVRMMEAFSKPVLEFSLFETNKSDEKKEENK